MRLTIVGGMSRGTGKSIFALISAAMPATWTATMTNIALGAGRRWARLRRWAA
jgi:hypothetical protein